MDVAEQLDQTEHLPAGHALERRRINRLPRNTLALVLAGGRGARLGPLTDWRAKPAVPFAGKFRIIDFPLSNCVNSGIRRIGICTQYKAQSLIRHVQRGWSFFDGRFGEFIELLPAQQRITADWYKGTADAVYQNLDILRRHHPDHVLILAGDHVYKMDYGKMLADHVSKSVNVTVSCIDVPLEEAGAFGVVQADEAGRIIGFQEKPAHPAPISGQADRVLASMGIYVFNAPFLYRELRRDAEDGTSTHDFGKDILPRLVGKGEAVHAHRFAESCVNVSGGVPYWRDVGTVDAFWEANIALTQVVPDLNLYDQDWPIWTHQVQLPPAKFVFDEVGRRGVATDSLISGGCIISGATVRRSLLSSSVHVQEYSLIEDSVILPNVEVGRGAVLKHVIVDKYCKIPPDLVVGVDPAANLERFHVTGKGITLITPEMLEQRVHHLQ